MPKLALGPIGILPPSGAAMGIVPPESCSGYQLVEGEIVSEDKTLEILAQKVLTLRNPTFFPGPLLLWAWTEETKRLAKASLELVAEVPGMNIIPMPDYRPIYPKIDPEAVINPCHPNLTIMHNKIQVCVFIGVHCHFANITLKMIRANTNCYTICICPHDCHEDALLSVRDMDVAKIQKITSYIKKAKAAGLTPWALTPQGKQELEEIRERKEKAKNPSKENATLFMDDLQTGLDENSE